MKFLVILGLFAAMFTIVMSRNANWGNRQPGDTLVVNKNITVFPVYGKYQDRIVKYDPLMFRKVITAIYVHDNFRNASGADVHLINGGIGLKYVNLRLHSSFSQGINSTVLIYGR